MRKIKQLLAVSCAALALWGCGESASQTDQTAAQEETVQTEAVSEEPEGAGETQGGQEEGAESAAKEQETTAPEYEDNFAVDQETAAEFAQRIKDAVAAKDLEALADLTAYPVYIGLTEDGMTVESREAFLDLGVDQVITPELQAAVEETDVHALEPSMAGFVMSGEEGRPNLIFGVVEGQLGIQGINY